MERVGNARSRKNQNLNSYYGRDVEQEEVLGLLDPILSRKTERRTVIVTGNGGVGKSRFINELAFLCTDILQKDVDLCTTASTKLDKYTPFGAFKRFIKLIVGKFKTKGIDLLRTKNFESEASSNLDGSFLMPKNFRYYLVLKR